MEENKVGVAMLLSGIATVIFWVFFTSFTTHTQLTNFLYQIWLDDGDCSCLCAVNSTFSIKK